MALTQIKSEGIKDSEVKNADMADDAVGVAELSATGTAGNTTYLRGDNTWTVPPDTNTQLSTEQVQDIVGGMFTGNTETNITATYEDGDGTIDLVASAGETDRMPLAGGTFTGDVTFDGATAGRDIVFDRSDNALEFADNAHLTFGGGNLDIYHDGTDNYIYNNVTNLYFRSASNDKLISLINDGAVELYYDNSKKFGTSSGGIYVDGIVEPLANNTQNIGKTDYRWHDVFIGDGGKLSLGASDDIQIWHDAGAGDNIRGAGTKLEIRSPDLKLQNSASETYIRCISDGAVELYHNNVKKLETSSGGIVVSGSLEVNGGDVDFSDHLTLTTDDKAIKFGADSDALIKHTGSHFYMTNTTGNWYIQPKANETAIEIIPDGKVGLRYDNVTKLETSSAGGTLTGDWAGKVGLQEVDMWRISSGSSSSSLDIMSNWERNDNSGSGYLGTGMSESSGYWTFPKTGYWRIDFKATAWHNDYRRRYVYNKILVTTNNSNYSAVSEGYGNITDPNSDAHYVSVNASYIFDVDSVTNCKCYFWAGADGAVSWVGSSDMNYTSVIFTRLGDT